MTSLRKWTIATAMAVGAALAWPAHTLHAQASQVPAEIQAELLAKLEGYNRTFVARAGSLARILIVVRPGSAKSEVSAAEMKSALSRLDRVGGLAHEERVVPYAGAPELAQRCRAEQIAAVYFTPGFDDDLQSLQAAMSDSNVLTLGAVAEYVPKGIVLGFELESGKPKILINLDQARRQGVDFPAEVLRLMRVYR